MARCKICGENAGWFKKTHAECVRSMTDLRSEIHKLVSAAVPQISLHGEIESNVKSVVSNSELIVQPDFVRQALASGWKSVSNRALANDGIPDDLYHALINFVNVNNLWERELQNDEDYSDFIFWSVLKDLGDSRIPGVNVQTTEFIPLNLQRDESLIWVIDGVRYMRKVTSKSLVGGSTGGAIELGSGIYYGKSGFELHEISVEGTEVVATGLLAITTRHIYFSGEGTYFRVRYSDIVATESYKDGIGFQREGNDGLEYFLTDDVWRLWNLLENLKSEPVLAEYPTDS